MQRVQHRERLVIAHAEIVNHVGKPYGSVPVENSNSAILMMQSAKNRVGDNAAVELNCTCEPMRSAWIEEGVML